MTKSTLARLRLHANPDCPECGGEGVLSIVWNNNPDREEDIACDEPGCAAETLLAIDGPDDHSDAWSGGFAPNH